MSSMNLMRSFELKGFEELRPGELFLAGWASGPLIAIAVSSNAVIGSTAIVVLSSPDPDRRHPFLSDLKIVGSVISLGTEWILEPDLKGPIRTGAKVLGLDLGSIVIAQNSEFLRVVGLNPGSWSALSLDLRSFKVGPHPKAAPDEDFASVDRWRIRLIAASQPLAHEPFFFFSGAGEHNAATETVANIGWTLDSVDREPAGQAA